MSTSIISTQRSIERSAHLTAPLSRTGADDETLVIAVRNGDQRAYGELWKRHSRAGLRAAQSFRHLGEPDDLLAEAFTNIYTILQSGGGPTGAFRPYLYTTIRNLSIRNIRQLRTVAEVDLNLIAAPEAQHAATDMGLDRSLTAVAFRSLPERWQTVLWYIEVERMSTVDVGEIMGLSSNAVSALGHRAREALRGAWLQAHISDDSLSGDHSVVLSRVGEYAQGTLSARDARRVSEHLKVCVRCSIIVEEVEEVAGRLAVVLLPILLGAGAAAFLAQAIESGASLPTTLAVSFTPLSPPQLSSTPPSPRQLARSGGATSAGSANTTAEHKSVSGVTIVAAALIGAAVLFVVGGGVDAWALTHSGISTGATQLQNTSSSAVAPENIPALTPDVTPISPLEVDPTVDPDLVSPPVPMRRPLNNSRASSPDASGSGAGALSQVVGALPASLVLPARPVVTMNWTATQATAPRFTGTAEPGATVDIFTDDPARANSPVLAQVTADSSGKWTFGELAGFLPSMRSLSISQTDASGNRSPSASLGLFNFIPTFVSPTNGAIVNGSSVSVKLTGWPGSQIMMSLNGHAFGPLTFDSSGSVSAAVPASDPVSELVNMTAKYSAGTPSSYAAFVYFTTQP